jgi:hypothetical protein
MILKHKNKNTPIASLPLAAVSHSPVSSGSPRPRPTHETRRRGELAGAPHEHLKLFLAVGPHLVGQFAQFYHLVTRVELMVLYYRSTFQTTACKESTKRSRLILTLLLIISRVQPRGMWRRYCPPPSTFPRLAACFHRFPCVPALYLGHSLASPLTIHIPRRSPSTHPIVPRVTNHQSTTETATVASLGFVVYFFRISFNFINTHPRLNEFC